VPPPAGTRLYFTPFNTIYRSYPLKLPTLEPQTLVPSGEYIKNILWRKNEPPKFPCLQ